ncbi:ABC transporter substrate-binding protein [Microbacterium halophytorum]|uniref:ABC transporter substrate-binding protein n=1 Tax=Microbacterium halophytorum TaxID=2067568 RepID=UPI000CFC4C40|nr:ABC transporter substrate-binding protein [Microbacterium halophytorum]
MFSRTRITAIAAVAATGLLLASCSQGSPSGGGGEGGSGETEGLTSVTVGVLKIAPSAAVQYGIDEGIFEEHGLDVTLAEAQGGAAMLPSVSTGEYDFGIGNGLSVLTAATQGIDMRMVSGYSYSLAEGEDINAVVVRAGDGIESWSDLEGKTVATNTLKTQGDLTINEAIERDGGDPSSVEYIEVPFPDALAQLEAGNADAVWIPEPFYSAAKADAETFSIVGFPNQDSIPGLPTMVSFASGATVDDNPELVQQWRDALTETLDAATADDEGLRETIVEFTGMPAETVEVIGLERLSGELEDDLIVQLSDMAVKWGFLESEPDLDTVIAP